MTQTEYEQKKRECWEEFIDEGKHRLFSRYEIFCAAFDRAYALGKQETDAEEPKADVTMKARRKSDGEIIEVREWRGTSDVIYSSPDMNRYYQASDLDFNLDAEETVISGWAARDEGRFLGLYPWPPKRGDVAWICGACMVLPINIFPDLTWSDDPEPVEIIIKRKKK